MTKFWTYTIAGVCYGAAGMFMTAQIGAGDPLIGAKFLLKIFAAVVIGGTLIGGGRGGCVGTVFGALTLTIILTIFLLLGMRTWYVPLAEGAILIFAVLGLSMSRDLPVVDVVRGWRQALRTRWRAPVRPSADLGGDGLLQDLLGRTAARGGPDLTRPTAGWFTRNQATLRYISPTYVMFAVIVIATVVIFGENLSALEYLNVLLLFTAFLAILGLGQGAVIISGGLDLSVAWAITFPAIVVTTFCFGENGPAYWAVPLALAIGLAIGCLNGLMIVLFRMSPIIVTLAMAGMLEGISLIFSDGAPIGGSPPVLRWFVSGRLLGIAPIGWFLIAFAIAATIFLNRTAFRAQALHGRQQRHRGAALRCLDRLRHRRRLHAERLLLRAGGRAALGLQRAGVLRYGRSVPAAIDCRGGAGRHVDHRRARSLRRHPGRRPAVHGARLAADGNDAARGRAQYHLRTRAARRHRRASGARGWMTRFGSARMDDALREGADG